MQMEQDQNGSFACAFVGTHSGLRAIDPPTATHITRDLQLSLFRPLMTLLLDQRHTDSGFHIVLLYTHC